MITNDKYSWDLSHMYPNIDQWKRDFNEVNGLLDKLLVYKDQVTSSAQNLYTTLKLRDELSLKLTSLYVYAKMCFDEDMKNPEAKDLYERVDALYTKISNSIAFLEPELITMEESTFNNFKNEVADLNIYNHMFEKLFKQKEHILSTEMEETLTQMSSLGSSFEKVYDDLTVNDADFPYVEDSKGEKIKATNANYSKALISQDRTLRKNFFKGLLGVYQNFINSITSTYYGSVKHDVYVAKLRKYKSSRDMALDLNFIPSAVYDNLISTVKDNSHVLQEYIAFRKEILGLETIHFYDLFVPLVKDIDKNYTYEEAQELVLEATKVLGEDYTSVLKEAFNNRWIDVYPGDNKVSGAYATGAYGHHPYSLLNFTGTLNDVFTIAHELGHVMHTYYSNKYQPFIDSDYTIFTAEVASTVNEQLLLRYLLNKTTDQNEKALLLSTHLDNIRSTLFRQTLFADFEYQAHKLVEEENPLTPNVLCDIHKELYRIYHGDVFTIDPELQYEWARIPHFYRSFYVFQYSTGISAAISLTKKILKEGEPAVKRYREFLTKGGSDYSINLLKLAGVDMTSPQPILDAIDSFKETLNELKKKP